MNFKNILFYIPIIFITACNKDNSPFPSKGVDIYVTGRISDNYGGNIAAAYWKNGVEVKLTTGSAWAQGNAIAVQSGNIYVAGYTTAANNDSVATYWKNGAMVKLTDSLSSSIANAIVINGGDVYIAGTINNVPVYWKNGTKVTLSAKGSVYSVVTSIAVNGSDVYVAGFITINGGRIATYWKNGVEVMLPNSNYSTFAAAIAVQGNDVYIAGSSGNFLFTQAVYWKNGAEVILPTSSPTGPLPQYSGFAEATGIVIEGNDVYISGENGQLQSEYTGGGISEFHMIYWKNGVVANSTGVQIFSSSLISGPIAAIGNNIYVAGSLGYYPGYWENGTFKKFNNSEGLAIGITIAQN